MPARALQTFLSAIFDIGVEKCGKEFADEVVSLRRERERLLSDSWRERPPEDFPPSEQEEVFREIDFDTVITHAARYLERKDYLAFLYEIADLAARSGEFEKAQRLLTLITTRYIRSADKPLLAKTHQRLGDIASYQNDFLTANKEYRHSLKLYDRLNDSEGSVSIKNSMATIFMEEGKLSHAESLFLEAKELATGENHTSMLVKINCNLGNLYLICGSWEESMSYFKEALTLLGAQRDDIRQAQIHHNMAIVYKWQKDYTHAMEHLEKSIEFSTEANDPYQKGLSYLEQAEVTCHMGNNSAATALATTAFQIFSELGDRLSIADVYRILGIINRESKRYDVAFSYLENSLRINEDYKNPLNMGETLYELAQVYVQKGESEKAIENLKSAIHHFEQIQAQAKITAVKEEIANLT